MRKSLALLAAIAFAAAIVAACGGSDSATSTPSTAPQGSTVTFAPPATGSSAATARPTRTANAPTGAALQPCSIANQAQVQTLIGVISDAAPTTNQCTYTGQAGQLVIQLSAETSTDAAKTKVANFGASGTSVTVGDGGQYLGGTTSSLVFSVGNRVAILNTTATGDSIETLMVDLAQGIAANLPS